MIDAHLCPRALALTTPVISSAPSLPSTLLCNISVGQLTTPYPTTVASSWLTVQFACSTVALACTRVTIPVISWPNTRDLMYEHHTVQCMPRTQAEYQHISGDVEALTHMVHITYISWVYSWPTLCNTLQGRHHIASPWHWPPLEIEDTCSGNMNPYELFWNTLDFLKTPLRQIWTLEAVSFETRVSPQGFLPVNPSGNVCSAWYRSYSTDINPLKLLRNTFKTCQ